MPLSSKSPLLPFILSAIVALVSAQDTDPITGVKTIPKPNNADGWTYYCSNPPKVPLCNKDCFTAINRLCAEDSLDEALTTTEGNCELIYLPPPWQWNSKNPAPLSGTEQKCIEQFTGILRMAGHNAGEAAGADENYCTTSGGGGTFGWWDDGTPVKDSPRMIIKTKGTDQCGQAMAAHQQATAVVPWNPDWIKDTDQVVLEVNPPSLTNDILAAITALPTPNPVCEKEVCDIYGKPYYAKAVSNPWDDGTKDMYRHRVLFNGWATQQPTSDRFFNALAERCQAWPNNWQVWKNDTADGDSATYADFGLPSTQKEKIKEKIFPIGEVRDFCWCIPYAIFDASVGLETSVTGFCSPQTKFPGNTDEFQPAKRGLGNLERHEGPGMFRHVTGTVEEVKARKAKREAERELQREVERIERIKREVSAYENLDEEEEF